MTAKIIDCRKIAANLNAKTANEVAILKSKYEKVPKIMTIKIGNDSASNLYLKLRDEACRKTGILSNHLEFNENVTENEVLDSIGQLNKDKNIHGILIQFPIPKKISSKKLLLKINPKKDVEGLNPLNLGKTIIGNENLIPCTPKAVLTILNHENTHLRGKNVVVVNHSNIVGKPLSILLLNRNATVSVCHVFTDNLSQYLKKADIIISAAGVSKLISKENVKKDAFVIDVGIVKTKDGICGDVDFSSVIEKAGKITPVPGGVGPVTIASSLQNMITTFRNCLEEKS
jgi:methylenetetrahydrofolate dehydrogenase (NADP+)/methenyltetrahydrofolate cyclohydrolase